MRLADINPTAVLLYVSILFLAAKVLGLLEPSKKKKKNSAQTVGKQGSTELDAANVRAERAEAMAEAARQEGVRDISELPRLTETEIEECDFAGRTHDAIQDAHNRLGDFFSGNALGMEGVFVRDVRAARYVLTKTPKMFKLDKGNVSPDEDKSETKGFTPISRNNLLQPMFFGTVFHLEGLAHRKHRRAIANALAARAETGNAYVREVEKELVNFWTKSEANAEGWHTVDVQKLSYLCMATGAIQVALGPEFELTQEIRDVLWKGVCECEEADPAVDVPLAVGGTERAVMLEVLDVLKKYVSTMPPSTDTKSALHGMQQQDVSMTEIAATLVNFAVAAGESPASGAAHTLATIARLPEIQEQCREEADASLPLSSGLPDAMDTQGKLEFTHRVVKESMRHRVPATVVTRVSTQETTLPAAGGHAVTIPADTRVIITMSAVHYNENEWHQPANFDPDRFITQSGKDPKAYLTFSAGPRMCPGERITMMWIQMLVGLVLRRFEMRAIPGQDPWDFPHARKFVSWANGGVLVQVRPREDAK